MPLAVMPQSFFNMMILVASRSERIDVVGLVLLSVAILVVDLVTFVSLHRCKALMKYEFYQRAFIVFVLVVMEYLVAHAAMIWALQVFVYQMIYFEKFYRKFEARILPMVVLIALIYYSFSSIWTYIGHAEEG